MPTSHRITTDPAEEIPIIAAIVAVVAVAIVLLLFVSAAVKVTREYERGIVFRLGRLRSEPKGPGLFLLIPAWSGSWLIANAAGLTLGLLIFLWERNRSSVATALLKPTVPVGE